MLSRFRYLYILIPPYLRFKLRKIISKRIARKVRWDFERVSRPDLSEGVNIIGLPFKYNGISKQLRYLAFDYLDKGIKISIYDFENTAGVDKNDPLFEYVSKDLPYKSNIWCFNFHNMIFAYHEIGLKAFIGKYNIGYFPWELDVIDNNDVINFKLCDEVWGISNFVVNTIKQYTDLPTKVLNIPVKIRESKFLTRQELNLSINKKIVLNIFDLNSSIYRKNPFDVIRIFKKAVEGRSDVLLVLKTRASSVNKYIKRIEREIDGDKRIIVITSDMSDREIMSLVNASDIYLSPHRSEGFGLVLMEALQLKKHVIATNYSGNQDFMQDQIYQSYSHLIDCEMVKVSKNEYFIENLNSCIWAQINIDAAAEKLKELL